MAPELYGSNRSKYGRNVDVWAVGVVLYLYICKEYPFDALTEKDLKTKILN
jgi:serine/threonine protein kinase